MRALEVDTLAFELGLPPNADLAAIAGASAEPWHAIWLDHRRVLTTIVTAIGTLVETNEHLLTVGPAPVPVPAGRASVVAEVDLRDVAYRAAAAGSARVLPPSLRDFLR